MGMFIYIRYRQGESSQPSLCETRDKRPLGRDQDKRLCHRHISVKIYCSQLMDPLTERQYARMLQKVESEEHCK